MPAPTSLSSVDCSCNSTSRPRRSSASATVRPPMPPPTTTILFGDDIATLRMKEIAVSRVRGVSAGSEQAPFRSHALSDHIRLLEKTPHVDHRLAGEVEVAIGRMWRAENEEIAALDHVVQGKQLRVGGDERIGGQHHAGMARERLLELVAQGGTGVFDLRLEGHAEQADRHPCEIVAPPEIVDH